MDHAATWRARFALGLLGAGLLLLVSVGFFVRGMSLGEFAPASDFSAYYTAGQVWGDGQGARLYDEALEERYHEALLPPGTHYPMVFNTPPLTAVLVAPLTVLPPTPAFVLFEVLQLALMAAAAAVVLREAWPEGVPGRVAAGLLAVGAPGGCLLLQAGQWDGVNALGLALAYVWWRRDRPAAAGAALALGMGIAKPHLGLGLALLLLGRREWRAVGGAALAVSALVLATLVAAGPAALAGFAGRLAEPASGGDVSLGLYGIPLAYGGGGVAAALVPAVAGGALCLWLGAWTRRERSRLDVGLAAATVVSLLISVHLLAHDLAVLVPVFCWLVAAAAQRKHAWPDGESLVLVASWLVLGIAAWQLDVGPRPSAPPGPVTPWLLCIALVWLALRMRGVTHAPAAGPRALPATP